MSVSLAARCVAPHLRCLHLCGYLPFPSHSRSRSPFRVLHYAYCLAVLGVCCVYLVQECVYAYQERGDMDKFSRVMFLLLCHVTSIAKQVVFISKTTRIDTLLSEYVDPTEAEGRAMLVATCRRAGRLQRVYSGAAVCTCVLWLVWPVARFLHHQPVEFAFWLPAAPRRPALFVCVLLYSFYVTTLVGIANTTMDAFVAAVLAHCTTELRLLRKNIENLFATSRDISKSSGKQFQTVLMDQFRDCLLHYDKIIKTSSELQNLFGSAILLQFAIGGWILCMAAYKMVSLNVLSVEFASMTLFIMCILTELFLYCYYGNELTYESALVLDSLYACGWEGGEGGAGWSRAQLVAGERARRPLRAAAARLVPLSLETFLKILKSSYTFYAVLRQTK